MEVCLDLEGTLALVHETVIEEAGLEDSFSVEDITDYKFEKNKYMGLGEFLKVSERVWKRKWREIPPVETGLSEKVRKISGLENVELDVVTARPGLETEMKAWLRKQGISYRKFIVESNKLELKYDVYIEDCPKTAERASNHDGLKRFFLYDMPYNQEVAEDGKVRRFGDFSEIYREISNLK